MSLVRVHTRVVVSVGGVFGVRHVRIRTVASELCMSTQAMKLTNRMWGGVAPNAVVGAWISHSGRHLLLFGCRDGFGGKES